MKYVPVIDSDDIGRLYEAILKLETPEECYRFFETCDHPRDYRPMAQAPAGGQNAPGRVTYHES
jgi:uncharacterized protein YerC